MSFLLIAHGSLFTPINIPSPLSPPQRDSATKKNKEAERGEGGGEGGSKFIPDGAVVIEKETIKEVGTSSHLISKYTDAKLIDAQGGLILPGFICAHHHFYSAFARGMAVPGKPAKNFLEILKKLWWKLDAALDAESIYYSALVSAIDCIKHGVTTVIDHHESQSYQLGSLDEIEKAVREVGLRANLCLGVSDRYGKGKEGIQENERFLKKMRDIRYEIRAEAQNGKSLPLSRIPYPASDLVTASIGLHASFTVKDATLEECVDLAKKYKVGIHTHCAEDLLDEKDASKKYRKTVVERLYNAGVLGEKSLLVHCVHTNEKELELIRKTKTNVVHNPESNMNNAVGVADILKMMKKAITVGLGSDGMSSEMVSQARTAYLLQRHFHKNPSVGFVESAHMLIQNNARITSKLLARADSPLPLYQEGWTQSGRGVLRGVARRDRVCGEDKVKIGILEPGACADLIVMDYVPPTSISEKNFLGHLLFGLPYAKVKTVVVAGKIRMQDEKLVDLDETGILAKSREQAEKLWSRIK